MQQHFLQILHCPVSHSALQLQVIAYDPHDNRNVEYGILYAAADWFYPIIKGVPRLLVEAFIDYESFFVHHLPDYQQRRKLLEDNYGALVGHAVEKNTRTKKSFSLEWKFFNYEKDKLWDDDKEALVSRYLAEINETPAGLKGKTMFDAGCGNGLLSAWSAEKGAVVIAMDLSPAIEQVSKRFSGNNLLFIQGDVQFPPVQREYFDIVYSSGVLIHTSNTELSFECIEQTVKPGGKLCVWLYHPRKNFIHNVFNKIRKWTSVLPLNIQFYLYICTLFPISFIVKRIKGNRQNPREMMLQILDWFSPEFRWEHTHEEASGWFSKRNYKPIQITTTSLFGFSITGIKSSQ